jgi:hypothetical protein
MGRIGGPETSGLIHLMPRNNPDDGIIYFNRGGNLRSSIKCVLFHGENSASTFECVLRVTGSKIKIPAGSRGFLNRNVRTDPGTHATSCSVRTGILSGGKLAGA